MMCVLLTETNVKIFNKDMTIQEISYEDFCKQFHNNRTIIVDHVGVDFSLSCIKNCNIFDAYKAVYTERKILKPWEDIFLVRNVGYNIFRKESRFVQKNSVNEPALFNIIRQNSGVFFIEHIIAEFCKCTINFNKDICWLYVAQHVSSEIKVVAGIKTGIILSRTIGENMKDISKVLIDTIRYLNRFDFVKEIKIISAIDGIIIHGYEIIFLDLKKIALKMRLKNHKSIETMLVEFSQIHKNIKSVFIAKNYKAFIARNIKNICTILWSIIAIVCIALIKINKEISFQKDIIYGLNKTWPIFMENASKTFSIRIDKENFTYMKAIVNALKNSKDPLDVLQKVSEILQRYRVVAETVLLEKYDTLKIKCKLNAQQMMNLKKLSSKNMMIYVTNMQNINNRYEKLDESDEKIFGVEICIKMK